jgi:hypothetical protein
VPTEHQQPDHSGHSDGQDWARRLREVPDLLVAAELSLRPLAKGDVPVTDADARRIVGDACDMLHVASARVLDLMRRMPEWAPLEPAPGADGGHRQPPQAPSSARVR